ncbi:anaerobic ribonucleoside-triphosphate reductase activating protein [Candidatus Kuenenbacteria bacterium CG08_land_8_20_14_0_20_37_23]|uniref:Anaerobic ribonucleoside-triphosphate reductase activating protein n=1 Tax=Candidatus Kuenenbacteria bacterium CG08_land_8_20_14_0_20_37_23 TaxID=1974617 RepID=A0A2M6XTH5_9BACT|nr:MAG: anaerobic ribonucleoside-triphosphate reductase activating protein [Candidatus Kuenenbacteria bacterium CG08_land_8_20_14_0_20_37_23]
MIIGGLQKTSLQDYTGKVSAIIFTSGCNFVCGFCHNPELVTCINKEKAIEEEKIFRFLQKRKKVLDAVVITGGEPTMHKDLPRFIKQIREIGYLIKIDTNGSNPYMLEKLIKSNLVDYVAMDIKAPEISYQKVTNASIDFSKIMRSIRIIMKSAKDYEFRSTILPILHIKEDLIAMAKMIHGAKRYYLQKFEPAKKMNDIAFVNYKSYSDKEMKDLATLCRQYVDFCKFRH